ncbi:hypothetical protein [Pseudactinotalea sp.]|uniref:hypothetical protein n=1 Tax=Pseudactinotalea sp. TaxID=1926260 RepID=UPI003B3A6C81
MLIGMIRPREEVTAEVEGESLEAVQAKLEAHRPDGFELVSAPAEMIKGAALIRTKGTFQSRSGLREIEADDMDAMRAKVPDGWQLLSVRTV